MMHSQRGRRGWTLGAVALLLALLGTPASQGQELDERKALVRKEQDLLRAVERLSQEERFLLFQKACYTADSKYVVLNAASGTGKLKYKNRILRSFSIAFSRPGAAKKLKAGQYALSGKVDGSPKERQLVFTDPEIIIRTITSRSARDRRTQDHAIAVGTRDLAALYYSLEPGSYLYIFHD